jgi:uncharacterized protein
VTLAPTQKEDSSALKGVKLEMATKNTGLYAGLGVALVAIMGMVAVLIFAPLRPAQAQTTGTTRSTVDVAGEGSYLVQPDVVKLNVGVDVKAPTVSEAQQKASDQMKAITDALKSKGIKPEDLVTAYYNLNPDYTYPTQPGGKPTLNGYNVSTAVAVVIRDVNKTGEIIDAAGTAGATQIGSIQFTVSNTAEALKQARQLAIADAKVKAEQLAGAGNVKIGKIVNIVEYGNNIPNPIDAKGGARAAAPVAQAATVIEQGQFRVVVNVQVSYEIS